MNTEHSSLTFADLALAAPIHKAIKSVGYEVPSPIQAQAIPPLLAGKDLLGVAQTGTGKTAAFALPLLSNLDLKAKSVQILCLTPTRELAIQVAEAFQKYAQQLKGFQVLPVYGGTDYRSQIRRLERGVHVVVGTPGRVMDHMRKGTLKLDGIKTVVLDEADEMLRMGFIDDVEWILEHMPEQRQHAFFSATMPAPIKKLTKKFLNAPEEITIKVKTTTATGIRQRFVALKNNDKLNVLTRILEIEAFDAVIIFVRTKNLTLEISDKLKARGYAVSALNGDIAQNQREKIVNSLKKGRLDIIVATDVAARGLDVERVSHVFNYDAPYDTESYVHRIGRTGRAGREGDAILFINGRERRMLQMIEKAIGKKIEPFQFPSLADLNSRKQQQLFEQINLELVKNLSEYQQVVEDFLKAHPETSPEALATALASIVFDSAPFYLTEAFPGENKNTNSKKRDGDNAGKGSVSRRDRGKPAGGVKASVLKAGMARYQIAVGEKDKLNKRALLEALREHTGLDNRDIGQVQIGEHNTVLDLPEGMPADIFKALQKAKLNGKVMKIAELTPEEFSNFRFDNDEIAESARQKKSKSKSRAGRRENNKSKSRGRGKSDTKKNGSTKTKASAKNKTGKKKSR